MIWVDHRLQQVLKSTIKSLGSKFYSVGDVLCLLSDRLACLQLPQRPCRAITLLCDFYYQPSLMISRSHVCIPTVTRSPLSPTSILKLVHLPSLPLLLSRSYISPPSRKKPSRYMHKILVGFTQNTWIEHPSGRTLAHPLLKSLLDAGRWKLALSTSVE